MINQYLISLIILSTNKTQMINEAILMKKLRSLSCFSPIATSSRKAQLKLSREVYNDRENRKINKFLRERDEIDRKSKPAQTIKRISTEPDKNNYDQNELRQLNFVFDSEKKKNIVDESEIKKIFSLIVDTNLMGSSRKGFIKKRQSYRKKMQTIKKEEYQTKGRGRNNSPESSIIRLKSMTQSGKRSDFDLLSPLRLRKRLTVADSDSMPRRMSIVEKIKVSLKDQELKRAIKRLIEVTGETVQSRRYFIPQTLIFAKIMERYSLKKKQTHSQPSITNPEQDPHSFPVEIPHCQFVSLKDSRNSIDRIFNMEMKTALKIAFKIYDRNNNGTIDEKDIIQLFTLAESNQAMQKDLDIIIKNYKPNASHEKSQISNENSLQSPISIALNLKQKHSRKREKSFMSINSMSESHQKSYQEEKEQISGKFKKQKYFSFLETRRQFYSENRGRNNAISLDWTAFQKAFSNFLPKIFYDLLDFLFDCNSEEIFNKNLNQTLAIPQESEPSLNGKVFMRKSSSIKKTPILKYRMNTLQSVEKNEKKERNGLKSRNEMTSERIKIMINRVRSIDELEPMKYD